jgi:hypothetical protein
MGGSFAPGIAMRTMGYRPGVDEVEALMHFWRYVGHLMGVRPRWIPTTLREAVQLTYVTLVKGARGSGDDGIALCRSFAQAFAPPENATWRQRVEHGLHLGYTRFFTPPWTYRHNGLPPAGLWALHPLTRFPFVFAAETLRRHVPALEDVADRVARHSRERWFRKRSDRPAIYEPVDSFTR